MTFRVMTAMYEITYLLMIQIKDIHLRKYKRK